MNFQAGLGFAKIFRDSYLWSISDPSPFFRSSPRIEPRVRDQERQSARHRRDVTGLSLTSSDSRLERDPDRIVITRNVNGDLIPTTTGTSRVQPACFSALSGRRKRGPRSLLIDSSNRELEVDGRSILLLQIADPEHGGQMSSERALFCT